MEVSGSWVISCVIRGWHWTSCVVPRRYSISLPSVSTGAPFSLSVCLSISVSLYVCNMCVCLFLSHPTSRSSQIYTLASPAMGTVARAPSTSNCCIIFLVTFLVTNSDIWLHVVAYRVLKNIQADSFVTVYCMNFVLFVCVAVKLFSLCPSLHQIMATPLNKDNFVHRKVANNCQ